jgi:NAD(P)-dependent dehydrogenase (short-subunit alcohol dehydrogenase family)
VPIPPAYSVSKVGVTALTKIFARRADAEGKHVLLHTSDPGWVRVPGFAWFAMLNAYHNLITQVRTDMTNPKATRSPGMLVSLFYVLNRADNDRNNLVKGEVMSLIAKFVIADEGAETSVFLALDDVTVPRTKNGELWRDCNVKQW